MVKEALKVRSQVKRKKPTYKRVQAHQFSKLDDGKWRRPKGSGNKVRKGRKGKPSMLKVGYGSPKSVRGLNKEGLCEVLVYNVGDLKNVDSKSIALISRKTGARKKLAILEEAKKLKLNISNVKDIDSAIKTLSKEKKSVEKEAKEKPTKKEETKSKSEEKK